MSREATESNGSGSRSTNELSSHQVRRLLNLVTTLARTGAAGSVGDASFDSSSSTAAGSASDSSSYAMPLGMDTASLSDAQLLQWAQDVEALLRWGQALAVQAAGEIQQRTTAGRFIETGATTAVALLMQVLQLSGREAKVRIDLAQQIMPVADSISGQTAPAAHPVLGQAYFAGQLSQERASTTAKFLKDAQRLMANGIIGQDTLDDVEESLTATAAEEGPDFIRAVGNQIMSHIDPDGNKPTEADLRAKQGLFFRRARNGLVGIYGHCTIEQYEQVMATISYATNPNKHKDVSDINADSTTSRASGADATVASDGADQEHVWEQETPHEQESQCEQGTQCEPEAECEQGTLWEQLRQTSDLLNTAGPVRDSATAQPGPNPPPPPPAASGPQQPTGQESHSGSEQESQQRSEEESLQGWGKGWRRRLEEWEVPPRPPDAPENAIAPSYEGDSWFWLTSDPPPAWPSPPSGSTSTEGTANGPGCDGPHDGSIANGVGPHDGSTANGDGPHDSNTANAGSTAGDGFGPGWAGGLLGSPLPSQMDEGEPWPRFINGVWVPAPGSEAELDGLDSTDPANTDRAVDDTRTRGQKLLDGLIACVKLAARTGSLPLNGGLKTQLILTTTEAELHRKDGLGTAFTTFSGPMPLGLFDQSLCDPEITRLVYGDGQEIINAGRTQRLFTPPQRKLLLARDLGCAFPGCTAVAIWCEGHHIIPWQQGGKTDISNACLLCSRHHTLIHNSDWEVKLVAGTPWFTPPLQADRMRAPRRNLFHHGLTKDGRPYQPPRA